MTTQFGKRISDKAQTNLASEVQVALAEGEQLLWIGSGQWLVPPAITHLVITSFRIFGWLAPGGVKPVRPFFFREDVAIETSTKSRLIKITSPEGDHTFRLGHASDAAAMHESLEQARAALGEWDVARAEQAVETMQSERAQATLDAKATKSERKAALAAWPDTMVIGGSVSRAASAAIRRQNTGDDPWFIVVSGIAGVIAAWDDRLAIIKTGAMTSFMAGSTGGERSAVFHFVDITGIEYNSGFVNGVLEILTASYEGGSNKDYWAGFAKGHRGEAVGDPFKMSNTLPLDKGTYGLAATQITELRRKIGEAKRPQMRVNVAPATAAPSLADELQRMAALRDSGVLTEEEFAAAKAKLL